ncbi:MAG: hypothetical protein KOO60_04930 [Gemmatimonadales bacterium]|nr:hypothetical protein [Gemmatimonadales bacterium]
MRDRRNPWKWPAAVLLAVASLLGSVLLVPHSWIDFFFSPLSLNFSEEQSRPSDWLAILPPPAIRVISDPAEPKPRRIEPEPEELPQWDNPAWWREGWRIRTEIEFTPTPAPTSRDSVAVLLTELGIGQDLLTMVRPDSLLAIRLHMLKLEDSYKFDELKPYLSAMTRADAMRDIQSRAADMYDDFLRQEIMVPD